MYNVRRGLTSKEDTLPNRLTKEIKLKDQPNSYVPLEELKKKYYNIRGWDLNGVPTEKKLVKLKIMDKGAI